MKRSIGNYSFLFALFWLSGVAMAQESAIPEYNPPPEWNTPPPGFGPAPTNPNAGNQGTVPSGRGQAPGQNSPYPYDDDSYFVPIDPPSGFDYFDEEDDPVGGSAYSSKPRDRSPREVKDSFKMVQEPMVKRCSSWGHDLLGPSRFPTEGACTFELERKVDQGKASIEDLYDRIEFFKLRKVIRRELPSRAEAKKYELSFGKLKDALREAVRQGCTCQEE